ncbi:MAG: hypothetical protein GMKNLPBB_00283 [Myxococcota bacterium]|nr:hypothetical protein [Myxococcota bacterium]
MKKTIPLIVTFITGVIMTVEYFSPHPLVQHPKAAIEKWGISVMSAMIVLGTLNILIVNLPRIVRKERDWMYKAIMVAAMIATAGLGFYEQGKFDDKGSFSNWMFTHLLVPLQSTMFALLAFYITSAAFRAFRARSVEATLLLAAAIIVMLGRVPIGELLSAKLTGGALNLPDLVSWINDVPNLAGKRAIMVGAALGAISTGIRVILGMERSYLAG